MLPSLIAAAALTAAGADSAGLDLTAPVDLVVQAEAYDDLDDAPSPMRLKIEYNLHLAFGGGFVGAGGANFALMGANLAFCNNGFPDNCISWPISLGGGIGWTIAGVVNLVAGAAKKAQYERMTSTDSGTDDLDAFAPRLRQTDPARRAHVLWSLHWTP